MPKMASGYFTLTAFKRRQPRCRCGPVEAARAGDEQLIIDLRAIPAALLKASVDVADKFVLTG